jgi:predicted RNA-binding protein YlxR (DUF448 family)
MKEQQMRTCLGCGKRFPKTQLMKFILKQGVVRHDSKGTGQGRSAYCCNNNSCLRVFLGQKKKISRAFRVQDGQISFELKDGSKE